MMSGTNVNSTVSRCVLWHAVDAALPTDLVVSLERRGVEVSTCTCPYAALAKACLLERENDERTDEPGRRDSLVLVLVTPRHLWQPAEVVDAMRRYAPRTACWWYDEAANPKLRAVVDADVDQWVADGVRTGQPAVIRSRSGEDGRPRLKLSGDGESGRDDIASPSAVRVNGIHSEGPSVAHTRVDGRRQGIGGGSSVGGVEGAGGGGAVGMGSVGVGGQ